MDRLGDIALFLRVLDLGSITAAAHTLDLSVAVASQRLKRLERDLGVRLLHRTTRRLHPTPEGQQLAERGRVLVDDLEALADDLRESAQDVGGTLRVTLSASFGRQYISPLLPAFQARHRRLRISAHLSDDVVDLVQQGFDLAIRIGALDDSGLVARRIADNRRTLAASPAYLQRHGTPRTPQELMQHAGVLLMGRDGRQDLWTLQTPDGGQVRVRMQSRFESNFGELVRDAVLAGQGIGMHSYWHIADELRAGRLVEVMTDHPPPASNISAVMPARQLQPPRVRAFVDFLLEHFGQTPPWDAVSGT
ncbi:LysR family transcriptional regulator [Xanthomonas vesicatoria]|uniref:LysR family transcriptional regulator n=3 Tax=Xanthomonas vesicatoria TaxID=56460 RepID=A0AAJ0N4N3_9XANT|nr:LysR family transcriptional regulator [Xanthomonas vesicatoria]APO94501.1 LysR family transcriptional regulator [Xanthomonas vesicatoria]APP74737.1 LysR family transcriptional regulator [Xanthomonas vesicatoria ATCC 35937]EGD10207.1 transcriptional regulator, LysR family [Xanthomonas vesicatoria ATCC 35937]KHM90545.1 LysR family transcriptional regulator [Xanthomonas vesicatoria]KHM95882.1 LysR family transcriptional regulator [Xanthomonas vesicatoria]